jgi:16S rRNA (uracil1498-N3)-methyltransferase
LRLSVGANVECFDGGDKILVCEITSITKQTTTLKVLSSYTCEANPTQKVTLLQALPKGEKLELIIQKASEIGITEIKTFSSQFTIAKPNDNKLSRFEKIAISAAKQCGRSAVIKLSPNMTFKQMLSSLDEYDLVIFANETENNTGLQKLIKKDLNIALIVGSEGGFSKDEIDAIIAKGAKSISLGKRILRAETAAIALSAVVMYELGELGL